MARADGATDFLSLGNDQLVMEVSSIYREHDCLSFTSVENEWDMERRHSRMARMLGFAKAVPSQTAVLTDNTSFYFAAQIERVLPWPLVIAMSVEDDVACVPDVLHKLTPMTLIAATRST